MARFFTIGHSTRSIEEFVELLTSAAIRLVVDVRTIPRSRTNPQYNADALPDSLSKFQINYEHIAALGGLRGHKRDVPEAVNSFWQNKSFHNYADYALTPAFRDGLARRCAQEDGAPGATLRPEAAAERLRIVRIDLIG